MDEWSRLHRRRRCRRRTQILAEEEEASAARAAKGSPDSGASSAPRHRQRARATTNGLSSRAASLASTDATIPDLPKYREARALRRAQGTFVVRRAVVLPDEARPGEGASAAHAAARISRRPPAFSLPKILGLALQPALQRQLAQKLQLERMTPVQRQAIRRCSRGATCSCAADRVGKTLAAVPLVQRCSRRAPRRAATAAARPGRARSWWCRRASSRRSRTRCCRRCARRGSSSCLTGGERRVGEGAAAQGRRRRRDAAASPTTCARPPPRGVGVPAPRVRRGRPPPRARLRPALDEIITALDERAAPGATPQSALLSATLPAAPRTSPAARSPTPSPSTPLPSPPPLRRRQQARRPATATATATAATTTPATTPATATAGRWRRRRGCCGPVRVDCPPSSGSPRSSALRCAARRPGVPLLVFLSCDAVDFHEARDAADAPRRLRRRRPERGRRRRRRRR